MINFQGADDMRKTRKHHFGRWLGALLTILLLIWIGMGVYFFHVGMVPSHKSFVKNTKLTLRRSDPLYQQKKWFVHAGKKEWTMQSASGNYRLVADYIPAASHTNKNVVILHGFMGNKETMAAYASLFHSMDYNVLMPDARAQGKSEGKYIGYGWPERYDVRKWTDKLIKHNGQRSQVVIFGVSMGGATTMMTSGLKLPPQVKAFVEDCGYTSLAAELDHEAGHMYHLPTIVRVPAELSLSVVNRVANGFYTSEASAVNALHHNHLPMLFIHGSADTFVPTKMVYENYAATRGPKELWVVEGAGHASSYQHAPRAYKRHLEKFLNKYVK